MSVVDLAVVGIQLVLPLAWFSLAPLRSLSGYVARAIATGRFLFLATIVTTSV